MNKTNPPDLPQKRQIQVIKADKTEQHHAREHAIGLMRSLAKMYPKEAKDVVREVVGCVK
jgi:phosphoglycerate dehydrogenase-like enzyme